MQREYSTSHCEELILERDWYDLKRGSQCWRNCVRQENTLECLQIMWIVCCWKETCSSRMLSRQPRSMGNPVQRAVMFYNVPTKLFWRNLWKVEGNVLWNDSKGKAYWFWGERSSNFGYDGYISGEPNAAYQSCSVYCWWTCLWDLDCRSMTKTQRWWHLSQWLVKIMWIVNHGERMQTYLMYIRLLGHTKWTLKKVARSRFLQLRGTKIKAVHGTILA